MKTGVAILSLILWGLPGLQSQQLPVTTVIQTGHNNSVLALTFSPRDPVVATASSDNTVKLWSLESGKELRTWRHKDNVTAVAFSEDGKWIASGSLDGTVAVWNAESGDLVRRIDISPNHVLCVLFVPGSSQIVAGGGLSVYDGRQNFICEIWDVESGVRIDTLPPPDDIDNLRSMDITADGSRLALTDGHGLYVWDLRHRKFVWESTSGGALSADGNNFTTIRLLPGSQSILSANSGPVTLAGKALGMISQMKPTMSFSMKTFCDIHFRDVVTGRVIGEYRLPWYVGSLALNRDASMAVTIGPHFNIRPDVQFEFECRMIDMTTGQEHPLPLHDSLQKLVTTAGFSSDGKYVAFGLRDGQTHVMDLAGRRLHAVLRGQTLAAGGLAFSNDQLITLSGRSVWLWRLNKAAVSRFDTHHIWPPTSLAVHPSGQVMATGCARSVVKPSGLHDHYYEIKTWDLSSIREVGRITNVASDQGTESAVHVARGSFWYWAYFFGSTTRPIDPLVLAYSPDGMRLLKGGYGGTLSVMDASNLKEQHVIQGPKWIQSAGFGPSGWIAVGTGKYLSTGAEEGSLRVFNAQGKERPIKSKPHDQTVVSSVAFHPGGSFVAAAVNEYMDYSFSMWTWQLKGSRASIWDLATGNPVAGLACGPLKDIRFSPDGHGLLTAEEGGRVTWWDWKSSTKRFVLDGTRTAFSPRGDLIATLSKDGYVILWRTDHGKEIARLITVGESDYAIITPDNYYTASKGSLRGFHFSQGYRTYSFENFDLLFNRPDILLQRFPSPDTLLARSYYRAYLKRLSRMGFTEEEIGTDMHLPTVKVSNDVPSVTSDDSLSITAVGFDTKYPLDRFNIYVNDVPVFGSRGLPVREYDTSRIVRTMTIGLSRGRNKIDVSVHNRMGAESLRETFETQCTKPDTAPTTYVVVIGVSRYADSTFNLHYAAKDASDLADWFDTRSHGMHRTRIIRILDQAAIRETILGVRQILMHSGVDDRLIVFAAGHGVLDQKLDWYFATHDVDFENPSSRGLSYDELESLLDGVPSRHKLLMMDACHSGLLDKEEHRLGTAVASDSGRIRSRAFKTRLIRTSGFELRQSFELMQELFANLQRGSGARVISSASGAEYAWESADYRNGVFTYTLLEGLKSRRADSNSDGAITVSELRDYVIGRVVDLTGGLQHPTSRQESIEFDFDIP